MPGVSLPVVFVMDRERRDALAEIYSLIITIDQLEKAYIRDSVDQDDYTKACSRLLAQYQTLLKNRQLEADFGSLEQFCARYRIPHSSGVQRIEVGVPATAETNIYPQSTGDSGTPGAPSGNAVSAKLVSDVTGQFITAMDGLKLNLRAKDQLHPIFSDLVRSLNKVTGPNFAGKGKLVEWLVTLNKMKIDDELSDEQARQCLFDLQNVYNEFYTTL